MDFYSSGKFLISGEYLVMHGARALAVPLRLGQSLSVSENTTNGILSWKSLALGKSWFETTLALPSLKTIQTTDTEKSSFLVKILKAAHKLNPNVLGQSSGFHVLTEADFDIQWGLGSSSTLISNIAWWFNINPFELHFKVSKGSGYDIACARSATPILYELKNRRSFITTVPFSPPFKEQLFFVYLGKKQRSDVSIVQFAPRFTSRQREIKQISEISDAIVVSQQLDEFRQLLDEHESIMSQVLDLPTVKISHFSDLQGSVKSLGAWGGDFVLMTWEKSIPELQIYLASKGYQTWFGFDDMALTDPQS